MKLWDKMKDVLNLRTKKSDPEQVRYVYVPMRHAGVYVDHDTALKFSAVFRAISYISQTIACLSWNVIRESGERKRRIDHPVSGLIKTRPNPEMSAFAFRETLIAWALAWGNGYAEIERNAYGNPVALWPISPDRVSVKRDKETGQILYECTNYIGETVRIPRDDVFHLHGLGFDGLAGYSVISLAARSIGLSMAAEQYGEDFFANGTVPSGIAEHPQKLSKDAAERIKADIQANHKGAGKRFNVMVFEEGMTWKSIGLPPEDAQMLETRKFQVSDIARWFGLPPHKLADLERATFSNIEHQSIEVVNDALMPWIVRLEQEANYKLFSGRERGVYTKLNVASLMRGDDQSRSQYYKVMREIGVYSTNDIRRLEDMDPVGPEGDALILQLNQTTLDRIVSGEALQKQQSSQPEKKQPQEPVIEDAFRRILRREAGQLDQVRHKLNGDWSLFNDWTQRFFTKHRGYMADTLTPMAAGLSADICPDASPNGEITDVIDSCISRHIERSTIDLFDAFDGRGAIDIEGRARDEARSLIESVTSATLAAKEGKSDETH